MTNRKIEYWVIPPEGDAEFAASMEDVLETYEKPYDPARPVICMDEQPVQLIKETRTPIEGTVGHAKRIDYEYERAGTANIFMFTEPLAGWREAAAREKKTKIDWANEVGHLLESRYARPRRQPLPLQFGSSDSAKGSPAIPSPRIHAFPRHKPPTQDYATVRMPTPDAMR